MNTKEMGKMVTRDVDSQIRAVTYEEVEHFSEHGWVMLRGFIDTQLIQDLLQRAKALVDDERIRLRDAGAERYGIRPSLEESARIVDEDPVFHRFASSSRLGEASARLLGESVAMRRLDDRLLIKPAGEGGGPTPPHQDQRKRPMKCNSLQFWVALDEVTPEMGSMWFMSGSHKLGLYGDALFDSLEMLVERFPRLGQCGRSESQHYAPGDVTVHHGLTIHGAPANGSDRARWAYRIACFPSDALFTGESSQYTDGLTLASQQPFDHPNFPVIYTR